MSLDQFREQFEYLVGYEPPPLVIDSEGEAEVRSSVGLVD